MARIHRLWLTTGLATTAGLLIWGSWQPPSLSSYAQPSQFAIFDAPLLQSAADSVMLQSKVRALPGITACVVRPDKQLLVVAYHPDSINQSRLGQELALTARTPPPPSSNARQCPVPAGYVLALEKIRFTFNLRRLFVQI